ncbi:hypothetical protein X798_01666 [Onchocerca flexuosa]|uniref:Uncharacterized protein n=1 Tax=Onchocerca flexuosa TaxID=387005 RepID=A0A238C2H7_9BILA|nr:hypothetical protein X798_01666 [Onchocerca flexuosa]
MCPPKKIENNRSQQDISQQSQTDRPTEIAYQVNNIGIFTPKKVMTGELSTEVTDCKAGDTITEQKRPCSKALPGFKEVHPARSAIEITLK